MSPIYRFPALLLLLIGAAVSSGAAAAEAVYVTDELRLGLYEGEQTTGRPFRTMVSGARLEVLERSLMSMRVRTEDGDEGWVKSAYIVTNEPARRRLPALEKENERLNQRLADIEAERTEATARVAELQTELDETLKNIDNLPEIQKENSTLRAQIEAAGVRVELPWLAVVAVSAFVVGCAAGYLWLQRRVRKQFSGLKVY